MRRPRFRMRCTAESACNKTHVRSWIDFAVFMALQHFGNLIKTHAVLSKTQPVSMRLIALGRDRVRGDLCRRFADARSWRSAFAHACAIVKPQSTESAKTRIRNAGLTRCRKGTNADRRLYADPQKRINGKSSCVGCRQGAPSMAARRPKRAALQSRRSAAYSRVAAALGRGLTS